MGYEYLLFLLASFFLYQLAFSSSVTHLCSKDESISLLKFKNTLTVAASYSCFFYGQQSYPKTRSWNISRDCCSWDGVVCDDFTGHIIELDLGCSQLEGKIHSNSSLFQLSHLRMLNLSWNDFSNSHISPEFGKFSSLTHLDLSLSHFSGQIPCELSHLSKLQSLYLRDNFMLFGPHNFKLLLQNLTQLRELDLSFVNISSSIPPNISSHLTTLGLGGTGLYGIIPESIFHLPKLETLYLGGLPNLETLDLGGNNQLSGYFPNTKWNSSASLKVLSLFLVNFSGNFLPESLGYLTVLQFLSLDSCNLSGPIPRSLWNLTRLEYMDFVYNQLEGPIPLFTSGLRNLKSLSLSCNSLNGAIPSWVFSLPSLTTLDLSVNHFSGQLEDFNYNTLEWILLGLNQLQGPLPGSLQNLVNLTVLDLSYNNFSGNVDVSFFSNLKQLRRLGLSYNSISLTNENKVKSTLPKYLVYLFLSACEVKELDFLRSTEGLLSLDLSNNKIQRGIPDWAWSNWMHMEYLNLSHNMLTSIDQISSLSKLRTIDLGSNFIKGSLPILSPSVNSFFISNNSLSGEIPSSFCNFTSLIFLDLARNNLKGTIPQSFCNFTSLIVLDLARNNLKGTIPQCFCNLKLLKILDLARNNLKGTIPQCLGNMNDYLEVLDMKYNSLSGYLRTTFSSRSQLKTFNLHGNKVEGKIPRSLSNCKQLDVLDLGNNHLNDTFPMWLGTLPKLQVLSLRSNKLHGPIRTSRINNLFPQLRILDLSCNAFTAKLPTRLFQNLKGMRRIDQTMNSPRDLAQTYYQDSVTVVTKGLELEVVRILSLYSTMDLSNNKFEGHIPSVLGELISLRVLNLSYNGLEGHIPPSLGELSVVESLDLSFNKISGEIPQRLASLTYLEFLNLSSNHLTGCIPKGPQFATFENNSYEGNAGLRGFPVSEDCGSSWISDSNNTTFVPDEESDSSFLSELSWKVVLMGYGCGLFIGFIIAYFMLSSQNPNWLSGIAGDLEYRIIMRRRKKQRSQRHYRWRNNGF